MDGHFGRWRSALFPLLPLVRVQAGDGRRSDSLRLFRLSVRLWQPDFLKFQETDKSSWGEWATRAAPKVWDRRNINSEPPNLEFLFLRWWFDDLPDVDFSQGKQTTGFLPVCCSCQHLQELLWQVVESVTGTVSQDTKWVCRLFFTSEPLWGSCSGTCQELWAEGGRDHIGRLTSFLLHSSEGERPAYTKESLIPPRCLFWVITSTAIVNAGSRWG